MGKKYSRRTVGVTEKNAIFAFSKKQHTNATFKRVAKDNIFVLQKINIVFYIAIKKTFS